VLIGKIKIKAAGLLSDTDTDGARSRASNCARASSRSSADPITAALAATPVAW
jgi:hypothetical protein